MRLPPAYIAGRAQANLDGVLRARYHRKIGIEGHHAGYIAERDPHPVGDKALHFQGQIAVDFLREVQNGDKTPFLVLVGVYDLLNGLELFPLLRATVDVHSNLRAFFRTHAFSSGFCSLTLALDIHTRPLKIYHSYSEESRTLRICQIN